MVVQLENYIYGKRIAVFAKDETAKNILKDNKITFFYITDNTLIFSPEMKSILIDDEKKKIFLESDNYDVFFVSANGWMYKYYDNEKVDNAFMLTSKCNSNCIMCPASDKMRQCDDDITIDDVLKIIELMPTDAKHITITGGEPFLIGERIFEILMALKIKLDNTAFLLLTNGRAFAFSTFAQKLKETLPPKTIIGIPLHGPNSRVHNHITRAEYSFQQTMVGLRNILNLGIKVELRIVVSNLNYKYISEIAGLIIKEFPEVYRVTIIAIEAMGNAAKNIDDVWLPYPKAFNASKEAIDMLIENSIDVGLYNFPLCSVEEKYRYICNKSITDYKVRYSEKCNICKLKKSCGGVFASSLKYAKMDMEPVK